MSSRALKRAQQQKEQQLLEEQKERLGDQQEEEEEEDEQPITTTKPSLFAMLQDQEDDGDDDAGGDAADGEDAAQQQPDDSSPASKPQNKSSKAKKKKKKAKAKSKAPAGTSEQPDEEPDGTDEIDQALAALNARQSKTADKNGSLSLQNLNELSAYTTISTDDPGPSTSPEVCKHLSINHSDLIVSNELRRLFGRDAVAAEHDEEMQRNADRRQNRNRNEGVALSEAVTGPYSIGGPGLSKVLIKKNLFVLGKEDWPRVTANGLGMDVTKVSRDVKTYKFRRDKKYMAAQFEFSQCAESGDPNTLVSLVRYNPYHIGTLLRVSEIAKIMDKDYATSGEMLARALFAFGRSLHNTFAESVSQGKARLDFLHQENREFYLTAWKYIQNISMRATWRTAYEWCRLLLSLNPDDDPYCMRLMIDQYALRAKQPENLLELIDLPLFKPTWDSLPNIIYSRSIALRQLNRLDEAKEALEKAIRSFPTIAASLCHEIQFDKIPKSIWGFQVSSQPDHGRSRLHTELYVSQAVDIWKVPANSKLLYDVASSIEAIRNSGDTLSRDDDTISLDEARLVLLIDNPKLTTILPPEMKEKFTSQLDPLPPNDDASNPDSGDLNDPADLGTMDVPADELLRNNPRGYVAEIHGLTRFLRGLLSSGVRDVPEETAAGDEEVVTEALARRGMTVSQLRARVERLLGLRQALEGHEGQPITLEDGTPVTFASPHLQATVASDEYDDDEDDAEFHDAESDDNSADFHDATERGTWEHRG